MDFDAGLPIAVCTALGMAMLTAGVLRWQRRAHMLQRVRKLEIRLDASDAVRPRANLTARDFAGRIGARLEQRLPWGEVGSLAARLDRAGLTGGVRSVELLGWKALAVGFGVLVGLWGVLSYGLIGLVMLAAGVLIGWFGIDVVLARQHAGRCWEILRDLPTVMDLLVLSLEAGMGLDRALRTVVREYRSALSEEIHRVLNDIDLGIARGEAFERMALRVGIEDLRALSRAIVQSDELGVSLVGVMQTQSREVRLSRRRAAETEALQAPIKMLFPLVLFILPTLFMLLLGPVGLRAGAALSGAP